jgi:hypothetical protein
MLAEIFGHPQFFHPQSLRELKLFSSKIWGETPSIAAKT